MIIIFASNVLKKYLAKLKNKLGTSIIAFSHWDTQNMTTTILVWLVLPALHYRPFLQTKIQTRLILTNDKEYKQNYLYLPLISKFSPLTLSLPAVTKTEFLLTISIQSQVDKWRVNRKISVSGLSYDSIPNSPTKIISNVQETVRRITKRIMGVKGLTHYLP